MLSGSKLYGDGALFGSVPECSPQNRMKLVDSRVRFCAHGTLPLFQPAGTWTVLVAADAGEVNRGTVTWAMARPSRTHLSATSRRRPIRLDMAIPHWANFCRCLLLAF